MSVLIICVIASILCERRMANLEGLYKNKSFILECRQFKSCLVGYSWIHIELGRLWLEIRYYTFLGYFRSEFIHHGHIFGIFGKNSIFSMNELDQRLFSIYSISQI